MKSPHVSRRWLIIGVIVVLSTFGFAFAASITMPATDTNAGYGSKVVSGYTLSNITYTLNVANPGLIDTVKFNLDFAGGGGVSDTSTAVRARLYGGGTWLTCGGTGGNIWTCPSAGVTGATVTQTTQLEVAAAAK
jgi:hypothetical protein